MNETCGCCEGIQQLTPVVIANRPGLDALRYRAGTHASFFETMLAKLTNTPLRLGDVDTVLTDAEDANKLLYPLRGLTTRSPEDPAIAFLDAWALVADVLTFYQERIANEGYLRTAIERLSILELGKLVGYTLRPGVSASVYLAYTLEKNHDVVLLPGNRAQSIPGPGELPQSFETAEKLEARYAWNALPLRLERPQLIMVQDPTTISTAATQLAAPENIGDATSNAPLYFQGTATKLRPGDPLLFVSNDSKGGQAFIKVATIEPQTADKRTSVTLQKPPKPLVDPSNQPARLLVTPIKREQQPSLYSSLVDALSKPPSLQPRNSQVLERSVTQAFSNGSDLHPQMLTRFTPLLETTLYSGISKADITQGQPQQVQNVYALRVKAALFGHNLPSSEAPIRLSQGNNLLDLDAEYKEIVKDSWLVIESRPTNGHDQGKQFLIIGKVSDAWAITKTQTIKTNSTTTIGNNPPTTTDTTSTIGIRVTHMEVELLSPLPNGQQEMGLDLASTTIYAQSEELLLADEKVDNPIGNNTQETDHVELDDLYDGLKSGQRVIISGERADVFQADGLTPIPGIKTSELVMLTAVTQDVGRVQIPAGKGTIQTTTLPNDKQHTFLQFAKPLAYTYKRDTVTISANVVRATHGETRNEVLGSGNGSKALQQFALRQFPLTYLAAPTPEGAVSTLQVRVNDILWHEAESLTDLKPTDRSYITETDDAQKTTVIFGNGQYGARIPTGVENVKAVYRTGIGKPGNVRAEQISLLSTKPLGVKAVVNPLRASGGADRENRDQARRNVPLALLALDRLVSVQDYQDFTRTYAGIGKASAVRLSDRHQQLVHLTIAGAENIPIDTTSDLYLNLFQALLQFGDPNQPLKIELTEVLFLIISARVRVLPDYQFESVEAKLRTILLDVFSFDRRQLGQPVNESEVLSVMQGIAGVDYIDLEIMGAVGQENVLRAFDRLQQSQGKENPQEDEESEDQDEEKSETTTQELAEEFVELLGLTSVNDVPAHLAQINPQPIDPNNPQKLPKSFLPAQLVFLTPDVPDTLILTELPQ